MEQSQSLNGYTSATVVATTSNFIMVREEPFTHTYRTVIRLREQGTLKLRFGFSNTVDSTWEQGTIAWAGREGGAWRIEAACIADGGIDHNCSYNEGTLVHLTFGGTGTRDVLPGEQFYSDPVEIYLPDGHDLMFSWTLSAGPGASIPYNTEQMLVTAYDAPGFRAAQPNEDGFRKSDNLLVLPSWIGYEKDTVQELVFFGDSITQGVRTAQDGYDYWVAKIANQLGPACGVWNLGSGWARAYDAATDTAWLRKAKQGKDKIVLCLGVNDIDIGCRTAEQLLSDLQDIIYRLKNHNPDVKIILCTVPPFNFVEEREQIWRTVNARIRGLSLSGVDRVFDIAEVLSQPAPHEHLLQRQYMSSEFDPHPNGLAGTRIAEAFLRWY
ncbi:hypothetical protein J41TS4_27780 [Paenibacillus apis]|uniref:SGNH hydrolase-type esterase domain-containing protein n=2 Tax=Paenibacillus apis TaxID=1792174 RepID=A0A919Y613_9BACL|nr:hypothetical protein J41TS4_27780 [Paenibacillus apis]